MGREIRRVIPNWEHPKYTNDDAPYSNRVGQYRPLFDEDYETAIAEWIDNHQKWLLGEHEDQKNGQNSEYKYYAQWNGNAPEVEQYRPKWPEGSATWYQVYETVSEGTPVTPPFQTQDELIDYLVTNGDFWDQHRREDRTSSMPCEPWSRQSATNFVKGHGWMPSMIIANGEVLSGSKLAERS